MENNLQTIIDKSGLSGKKAADLFDNFKGYFEMCDDWTEKAKVITVTNETQKADMALAKVGRLFLRNKRIALEKWRVKTKEDSKLEGKAIDGISNILKALIIPIEKYLESQEKFVEIRQKEKEDKEFLEWKESEEKKRLEAEKVASIEAEKKARADADERQKIRAENDKLKAEADKKDRLIKKEREEAAAREKKIKAEANEKDQLIKKEREAAGERERKIKADAAERERKIKAEADKKTHQVGITEKPKPQPEKKAQHKCPNCGYNF